MRNNWGFFKRRITPNLRITGVVLVIGTIDGVAGAKFVACFLLEVFTAFFIILWLI